MIVAAVRYRNGRRDATGPLAELSERLDHDSFIWVGLHDPVAEEIAEVGAALGLHPLAREDALRSGQRPKAERYENSLFVVTRTARYHDDTESLEFGEIHLFVTEHAVVVIRHGEPTPLASVRTRLEREQALLSLGPIAVVHAVLDEVVDDYADCLAGIDDDVNEVELQVFSDDRASSAKTLERMYFLQREIRQLHRSMRPLASAIQTIVQDDDVQGLPPIAAYFRDVDGHLERQVDQLQSLRELLGAALGAHATQVSLRQNEDMRRISAWVAIVAVPTMIAGIYGMNFESMPELHWAFGYAFALSLMVACAVGLFIWFRRRKWL